MADTEYPQEPRVKLRNVGQTVVNWYYFHADFYLYRCR